MKNKKKMNCITIDGFGGPEKLIFTSTDLPRINSSEILIKVKAAGVNRPDLLQREGKYNPPKDANPLPGLEVAGEVLKVGSKVNIFKAHDIGYFFYNGGGDSQDTSNKIAEFTKEAGFPVTCIGIPKTIDNDLPFTDNCPGFGSVAKYIATSTKEAALDVRSMSHSSTKVFIFEVMGRHAGWIAASSGLAQSKDNSAPHIILLPEVPFNEAGFLKRVKEIVKREGFCVIVVSEGTKYKNGKFLADAGSTDSFGHKQLGGVAPRIAEMINKKLKYKYHWAVSDYLQRSARHISSQVDLDQAYAVGKAAVEYAIAGENSIMPVILRKKTKPYQWEIGKVELSKVANVEKKIPKNFISKDGFGITQSCKNYLRPLIQGEAKTPFEDGVIQTAHLKNKLVKKKLKSFKI